MAFAPDYARSRRFYVYYVDRGGNIRIDELRRSAGNPEAVEGGSRRTVVFQRHRNRNHKGGQLQFGPDGLLYAGVGDGGGSDSRGNGQSLRTKLGKILRVDPRRTRTRPYRIPSSNPFRRRRGVRKEIFSFGLRNPYRFSFDRAKGHMLIADVGQDAREEVNLVRTRRAGRPPRGGQNFGWSIFEGTRRFRSGRVRRHFRPALQRSHAGSVCSIIGGYVIRDRSLGRLYGRYVYGDLCDPNLRITGFRRGRARGDKRLGPRVPRLALLRRGRRRARLRDVGQRQRQPPRPPVTGRAAVLGRPTPGLRSSARRSRPSASRAARGRRPPARPAARPGAG